MGNAPQQGKPADIRIKPVLATGAQLSEILVTDSDGVRRISLNRPESRNGLTTDIVQELTGLFVTANADESVRVVVLTGEGGAFCSGLDLKAALAGAMTNIEEGMHTFHELVRALRGIMKPTIAAMDGAAAGFGADLALGCDLRIGSERARLGEKFIRIGLMPDGGGTYFLPQLVGLGKAYELIYEGRMIEAEEALTLGILNKIFPTDGFEAAISEYAGQLAKGPPKAFAVAKRALQLSAGDIDLSLEAESKGQIQLLGTADFMEGVQAFLMKREPNFTGR